MQLLTRQLQPSFLCPSCGSGPQASGAAPALPFVALGGSRQPRRSSSLGHKWREYASCTRNRGKAVLLQNNNAARGPACQRKGAARAVASEGDSRQVYQGMYGPWSVDEADEREVSDSFKKLLIYHLFTWQSYEMPYLTCSSRLYWLLWMKIHGLRCGCQD